jgi:serine/threonine-protein kinase HipA
MTGNEHSLDLYLGASNLIGNLILQEDQLFWQYNTSWQQSGFALSPHLPLNNSIPPVNVQRYVRNLLPEGNGLDELIAHIGNLSKNNTFGIIRALGMDTPGALTLLPSGQAYPSNANFIAVSNQELEHRLNTRDEYGLIIWQGKPRLSVAGVQDKINVVVDREGQLGFGDGTLCSTHILKFEKLKLSHLVLNEHFTLQLARECGLTVNHTNRFHFGEHPALLVERFDRKYLPTDEVGRRAVIDGCQALNLSPDYKYEKNFGSGRDVAHIRDGASFQKLFAFADQCDNPIATKAQILDWALFNLLVFNYDAHGKNISFYVGPNGFSLTPFYDLVNIKMYPEFEQEMAMGFGDEFDAAHINAYQLADFADTCQLPRHLVSRRLTFMTSNLIRALQKETSLEIHNEDERNYIERYRSEVLAHCEHLLEQATSILDISL